METYKKNWPKFIISFFLCFLVRLIPIRPPNIEPILAIQMPLSRAYGALAGFSFAFFNIVLFDLATDKLGVWTFSTAIAYGVLGLWATYYFKGKEGNKFDYVRFAIIGTLFFDAVTGLTFGPIFFGQSLSAALIGQIPFTAMHLLGNISFALFLSPAIYKYVLKNEKLEFAPLINLLNIRKAKSL